MTYFIYYISDLLTSMLHICLHFLRLKEGSNTFSTSVESLRSLQFNFVLEHIILFIYQRISKRGQVKLPMQCSLLDQRSRTSMIYILILETVAAKIDILSSDSQ